MYKSHPFISLEKHIDSLHKYYASFKSYVGDADVNEGINWHDWGKQNLYFQDRINKLEQGEKAYRDIRKDKHAVLSSMKYMIESNRIDLDTLKVLNIILSHHGSLKSIDLLLDHMYKYIEDSDLLCSYNTIEKIDSLLLREKFFTLEDIWYENKDRWTVNDSLDTRIKFSQLVDSDRLSAMRKSEFNLKDVPDLSFGKDALYYLDKIKKETKKTKLDKVRKKVTLNIEDLLKSDYGLFSLVLPTGLGKTITVARLMERMKNDVVYVVPYLSVSDQTYSVFKEIYKNRNDFGCWSFLSKHDSRFTDEEYLNDDEDLSVKDVITNWSSKIVITTTVQFFHSLLSLKGNTVRKLHNTYRSTILIDEPQAIPFEKWEFLKQIINYYARKLKWRVIFISATPPLMDSNVISIVKDDYKLFKSLDRTEIKYLGRKSGYSCILDWVNDSWKLTKTKSQLLWLLNVEKMARKVYEHAIKNIFDRKIVFISGKLPPMIRTWKVEKLKEMMARGEKVLVISTQVLEAGIDLDFDGVVRDLAPLPVLIQVAGRLNRKWKRKRETLYVMQLKEDTVYSDYEFRHTGEVLGQRKNNILEKDYYDVCREYYNLCKEMPPSDTPSEWMDQFTHLRDCSFQMIEEPDYQTSAVCMNMSEFLRSMSVKDRKKFKEDIKEYIGIDYRDPYLVMTEISRLHLELENTYHEEDKSYIYDEISKCKNYLSWFETTCAISDAKRELILEKEFYVTDVPLELLNF